MLCRKHIKSTTALSAILLKILKNLVADTVLVDFTYKGESKLEKSYKLVSYPNICSVFYEVFVYAANSKVNLYKLPTDSEISSAI